MNGSKELVLEGCVTAIVTDNKDEEKLGRVKVKIAAGSLQGYETDWIYCITKSHEQAYWLPNVGDKVVVVSLNGSDFGVIGSIPKKDQKAIVAHADDSENNIKMIKTKAGIVFTVDDTKKSVDILTTDGRKISISDQDKIMELSDGKNTVKMDDNGVEINSGKDLKLVAGNASITFSSSSMTIAFGSNKITIKDSEVSVDGGNVKISGKTAISIQSSAQLQLKGSITQIN